MKSLFLVVLCGAAGFFFACSGTGGGPIITPPPSVTISITSPDPVPTTVGSGGTIQFGATITGSSNVAVTWTAAPTTAGTINSAGLFTAAALAADTAVTVTATAMADTSKSATASFKVTGAATITSITPSTYYCDAECMLLQITVKGFGFTLDYIATNPDMNFQGNGPFSSSGFVLYFGMDTPHTSDGLFTISDCRSEGNGCSNPATFLEFGNQNNLVVNTATNSSLPGELFNVDRAAGAIWKFKPDGTPDGNLGSIGAPMPGSVDIAFDEDELGGAGAIWLLETGFIGGMTASGTPIGSAYDSAFTNTNSVGGIAAKNGIVCSTENTMGLLACFTAKSAQPNSTGNATFYRVPAGTEPWSLAMMANGTTTLIAVVDRAVPTLFWFSATVDQSGIVITFTRLGSVPLPFTPVGELRPGNEQAGTAGGWYVKWLAGGIVAVKAPVLNTATNTATDELFFVDTGKSTVGPAVDLPANSFRIAAEASGNAVDVESAAISPSNLSKVLLTISRVPTVGGISTIYTATIDPAAPVAGNALVGVGFGASPDGTHLYTCARNQCTALVNP